MNKRTLMGAPIVRTPTPTCFRRPYRHPCSGRRFCHEESKQTKRARVPDSGALVEYTPSHIWEQGGSDMKLFLFKHIFARSLETLKKDKCSSWYMDMDRNADLNPPDQLTLRPPPRLNSYQGRRTASITPKRIPGQIPRSFRNPKRCTRTKSP